MFATPAVMSRSAQAVSTALHVLFIVFLLMWSINPDVVPKPSEIVRIFAPRRLAAPSGGSGMRQPEPPRKGTPPQKASRAFVTPLIQRTDNVPKLMLPAAIDAPPEMNPATVSIGLPDGMGNLSAGPGGPFGIGRGNGGAPGNGSGDHRGDGDEDGVYAAGVHGVSLPVPLHTVEPEYSEAGRKARLSGSVLVVAEIDTGGRAGRRGAVAVQTGHERWKAGARAGDLRDQFPATVGASPFLRAMMQLLSGPHP